MRVETSSTFVVSFFSSSRKTMRFFIVDTVAVGKLSVVAWSWRAILLRRYRWQTHMYLPTAVQVRDATAALTASTLANDYTIALRYYLLTWP